LAVQLSLPLIWNVRSWSNDQICLTAWLHAVMTACNPDPWMLCFSSKLYTKLFTNDILPGLSIPHYFTDGLLILVKLNPASYEERRAKLSSCTWWFHWSFPFYRPSIEVVLLKFLFYFRLGFGFWWGIQAPRDDNCEQWFMV
jgi:hypothetical protein